MAVRKQNWVHANDIRACRIAALPARIWRVPLLFTLRSIKSSHERYGKHWHRATGHCQGLIALSEELGAEATKRIGIPDSKITVISSIVDIDEFSPAGEAAKRSTRYALGISGGEFAIGVVGVVRETKGQLSLIEQALPALCDLVPAAKVYLIGDFDPKTDAYSARCQDAVDEVGLSDRVIFCGHTEQVSDWYKALDLLLVPSQREGLARCMIEAMACGVPVVSFDVCSAREMLDETGAGVVVRQGDYTTLVDAVSRIAFDCEAREIMGDGGRKVAERCFSEQGIVEAYRELYGQMMEPRRAKGSLSDQIQGDSY